MRIAILVTHLLGTGHLKRAGMIADGFAAAGHDAVVISGGRDAPNAAPRLAELVPLSAIAASGPDFAGLIDGLGAPASDALLSERRDRIAAFVRAFRPQMLITELFPFGRRKLRTEFEAAIAAAGNALVFCSIRDILQRPRKPGRIEEAESRFADFFDGAFWHGDAALMPLSESWPLPQSLAPKIHETGYIGEAHAGFETTGDGVNEIIVAAGGGPVGDLLFSIAAEASAHSFQWRLLVGGNNREQRIAELRQRAPDNSHLTIEPVRPDFRDLLARCDLAVLQCGYNTALDVIATGARALFCPFETGGETEQIMRATAMRKRFGCGLLREAQLSPEALIDAVASTRTERTPDYRGIHLNGVETTVAMAESFVHARFGK